MIRRRGRRLSSVVGRSMSVTALVLGISICLSMMSSKFMTTSASARRGAAVFWTRRARGGGDVAAAAFARTRSVRSATTSGECDRDVRGGGNIIFHRNSISPAERAPATSGRLFSTGKNDGDASAMSRSRAPFQMPKHSPNDASPVVVGGGGKRGGKADGAAVQPKSWEALGLWPDFVDAVRGKDFRHDLPTTVQQLVVPELLFRPDQSVTFLAATGSGKTLAYALPLMQILKGRELAADGGVGDGVDERRMQRPRVLVLAPTRELAQQITAVVKRLSHVVKLSSRSLTGGDDYGRQRKSLSNRRVDVVVATPARLLKHWRDGNVFLSSVGHVVVDEMDTMIEQGFAHDLRQILYPLLYRKQAEQKDVDPLGDYRPGESPRVIMTSATMTQAIQKMIGDDDVRSGVVNARKHYGKSSPAGASPDQKRLLLPPMKVIKAPGLHKAVPQLRQVFVDVGATDKMSLLVDILSSGGSGAAIANQSGRDGVAKEGEDRRRRRALTMVFCNTAASCRAVQFALDEAKVGSLSYHGDLNSIVRSENLDRFRAAGHDDDEDRRVLVCTDLAARGLDVPEVDHVVMFDFPLNALDYLHRCGRTARGVVATGRNQSNLGNDGRVTALVTKRDKVLANAIERAVLRGDPLDGLSSRKSDYLPGGRLDPSSSSSSSSGRSPGGRGNKSGDRPTPGSRKLRLSKRGRPGKKAKIGAGRRRGGR